MRSSEILGPALVAMLPLICVGQAPAPLSFEVASVKKAPPGAAGPPLEVTQGGGFHARTTLDFLIQIAYAIKPFQLLNAPGWLHSEEYSIAAKPPAGYAPKQPGRADKELAERIQSLLAERFQLAIHRETREMPTYVLVVAKDGPKLKAADENETFKLRLGRGRIANDGGASISMLISLLENRLDKRVIDETGLTGLYKFNLSFAPEPPAGQAPIPADETAPSLYTALQEQLGLRLETKRRPVEMIVIDRVERPSEN